MHDYALEVAIAAAKEAGELLRVGLRTDKAAQCKSHRHDPVTLFDRRAEKVIVATIERSFPDHDFLSEEGTVKSKGSPYCWVIDPLDGTNNFLCGFPQFAVSIALLQEEITLVASIYDPLREELFTAIRGRGARLNEERMKVSSQQTLAGALIGAGFSSRPERAMITQAKLKELIPHARGIRAAGSACLDLAYVAAGRLDAAWYVSLSPWDVAAGTCLISEAGGQVSNLAGEPLVDPQAGILATNGHLHRQMLAIVGTR